MADAIISAIIGDVVSRAVSLLIARFSNNQESPEDKLQKLRHLLIRIHSVVEEAKGRQISNHGTLQWLSELIDGEYQGCYLLDSVEGGGGRHEVDRDDEDNKVIPQVSTLSLFNPAKRVRVAAGRTMRLHHDDTDISVDEIERVLQRLQGLSHDLRDFILLLQSCKPVRRPLPTSIFRDGQMFGRHVEKERIINFLLHEEDDDQTTAGLSVLPIVGGSGVGKTTLVQYACDDARVRSHFPEIMLYNFSSTYDVKRNEGNWSNDPIELFNNGNTFHDKHQRCLLIFEDVDMHRKQMLEEFLHRSTHSKVGRIKIIITTNNRRVANIVGTVEVEPIMLKPLPGPEYWFFFKALAFAGRDTEDNPRLISAGKAIARKLKGSFFGAKIVGGVLRDQPAPMLWCKVLRSSMMSPLGDGISYISDLAHSLLPGHVDMCSVTLCKDFSSHTTRQLAALRDLHGAVPHDSMLACWADDVRFAKVLLCKSVLPFSNHYYIACCSCTCKVGIENPCSKLVVRHV